MSSYHALDAANDIEAQPASNFFTKMFVKAASDPKNQKMMIDAASDPKNQKFVIDAASDPRNQAIVAKAMQDPSNQKIMAKAASNPDNQAAVAKNAGFFAKVASSAATGNSEPGFIERAQEKAETSSNFSKYWMWILGFAAVGFCFLVFSMTLLPFILVSPGRFSGFFAISCICFLSSIALWKGPSNFFRTMLQADKLPYSICYILSIIGTFVSTEVYESYVFAFIFAILQIITVMWLAGTTVPGGVQGVKSCQLFCWRGIKSCFTREK